MLFHKKYGTYYRTTASILKEAARGTLTGKKLNSLVMENAFSESLLTIPDGLKGEKWRLLHDNLSTPLEEEPFMPLTTVEKRWMKAVLLDPRIWILSFGSVIKVIEPDSFIALLRKRIAKQGATFLPGKQGINGV